MATASAVQEVKDAGAQKFLMVALAQIQPSPTNPRQHYDQNGLLELAASIKSSGVRQPVLIRPLDARDWQERLERDPRSLKFELVVGERRWRASKLAGKLEIPALISPMSNAEALEVQVIENLQREDVHPLDEASGYKALLEKQPEPNSPQHTVDTIAARVGKSVGYVYARLKLLNLAPAALSAFQDGHITPGHAILIARLGMDDQIRALRACFDPYDRYDRKKTTLAELMEDSEGEPIAEKKLREWIQEHVNLLLSKAPWKLDDAQLVPAAGSCTDCPKHSGHNPALFADLVEKDAKDVCFDSACYHNKQQALVKVQLAAAKEKAAEAEEDKPDLLQLSERQSYAKPKEGQALWKQGQWLPAAKGSCKHVQAGLIVKGENAGQRKSVCTEPGCKVHKKQLYSSPGGGSTYDRAAHEDEEFKRHKARVASNKRAVARFLLARAVIKNVGTKLPTEFLRVLAKSTRPDENTAELVGEKKLNIADASPVKLHQILVAAAAERFLSTAWGDKDVEQRRDLIHLAKLFKVDGKKILTSADKQIAAAQSCRECGCIAQAACEYWNGSKHVCCSWKEKDLCSNPKCLERAAKKAGPEKKAKAAKAKVGAK